jgi:hypothetical protein
MLEQSFTSTLLSFPTVGKVDREARRMGFEGVKLGDSLPAGMREQSFFVTVSFPTVGKVDSRRLDGWG